MKDRTVREVPFSPWDASRVAQLSLYAGAKVLGADTNSLDRYYSAKPGAKERGVIKAMIRENLAQDSAATLIKSNLDFVASTGIRVAPEFVRVSADAYNAYSKNGKIDSEDILAQSEQVKARRLISLE